MKFFVPALLALSLPLAASAASAAPANAPVVKSPASKISIDPKARAIFARATKLYGAAKGLSAIWKGYVDESGIANSSLDFDRAGRLRLINGGNFEPLVIVDGKTKWILNVALPNQKGHVSYSKEEADKGSALFEMGLIAPGLSNILGDLLVQSSPLDAERVKTAFEVYGLRAFRAETLSPQPLNGQMCDLVRITFVSSTSTGRERLEQRTYWFSRSDARLMRLQGKIMHGGKQKSVGDWQMSKQEFNPKFAPGIFRFTPPRGAVLQKN